MFVDALKVAEKFTKPVIISTRKVDGSVECGAGAFVVLNEEGWCVSVAHIFQSLVKWRTDAPKIAESEAEIRRIDDPATDLSAAEKKRARRKWRLDAELVRNHSFWWGRDGVVAVETRVNPDLDLAVFRLEPFDPAWVPVYPAVKDPSSKMSSGRSLCRLGFPFHEIGATYDEVSERFVLDPGVVPLPLFPIEGMFTRVWDQGTTPDGRFPIRLIETSSPGLRGQSGGPVFDVSGTVWGIQSRTSHLPLGFSPTIKQGGRDVVEHQFLNVGLAVHPASLVAFLESEGVEVRLAPE